MKRNADIGLFTNPSTLIELGLDAIYFVGHVLIPVRAGPEFERGGDSRCPHAMDFFVAAPDGGKHRIPITLDVGAIGVQLNLQAGFRENSLAGGNVW